MPLLFIAMQHSKTPFSDAERGFAILHCYEKQRHFCFLYE